MGFRRPLKCVLVCSLSVGTARAEDASVVYVGGPCAPPGVLMPRVILILGAELAPTSVATLGVILPRPSDTLLGIDECTDAPPSARVTLWQRGERRERTVILTDVAPEMRSRTLALALAETLRDPEKTSPVAPGPPPWSAALSILPATRPAFESEAHTDRADRAEPAFGPWASAEGRFALAESTPVLGLAGGLAWKRVALGLVALGTRQRASIGAVSLGALAGRANVDALELDPHVRLRLTADLGIAAGTGSPDPAATGHSATSLHASLAVGIAPIIPVAPRWAFEGFAGAGYASSLTARVDGSDATSLAGWFLSATVGVRRSVSP
jgi:hypothetical protein